MRVLIVKISSIGDILHTLPALTDVMHVFPEVLFSWVVEENFTQIPSWHPAVFEILPVAIRRWRKNWFNTTVLKEYCNFKCRLQQKKYDMVIDAQGLIKSAALITRIARGEKHGLNYKSAREPLASWFYDHQYAINKQQHAVTRMRQLFAASLGYSLPDCYGDYAITENFKSQLSGDPYSDPYLIFLHGASHFSKHWPESHWRELIALASDFGYKIKLPWGVEYERLRAQRLAKKYDRAEVLPPLSLTQIAKQLASATAIVSIDSGLSHLAAALGRPNLTLYGPTNPNIIGTYGRHQEILCAKNGKMDNLTVMHVWKKLRLILCSRK